MVVGFVLSASLENTAIDSDEVGGDCHVGLIGENYPSLDHYPQERRSGFIHPQSLSFWHIYQVATVGFEVVAPS